MAVMAVVAKITIQNLMTLKLVLLLQKLKYLCLNYVFIFHKLKLLLIAF